MTTRHRLNRGGHRQANSALYRAAIVRPQYHERTQAYFTRRIAEGRTKAEIICCLKCLLLAKSRATSNRFAKPGSHWFSLLDTYKGFSALTVIINGL